MNNDVHAGYYIINRVTSQGNTPAEQITTPPLSQPPKQAAPSRIPSSTVSGTPSGTPSGVSSSTSAITNKQFSPTNPVSHLPPPTSPSRPSENSTAQPARPSREQPTANQNRSPGRIGPFRRLWHLDKN